MKLRNMLIFACLIVIHIMQRYYSSSAGYTISRARTMPLKTRLSSF